MAWDSAAPLVAAMAQMVSVPEQFEPAALPGLAAQTREENSLADVVRSKLEQPDQAETAVPDWGTVELALFAVAPA